MHLQPAPPAVLRASSYPRQALLHASASAPDALDVESIGYLVPTQFVGRVHSVFSHACNIACRDTLLTLCAADAGRGPTTMTLAQRAPGLRRLFDSGARVRCLDGRMRSGRIEVRLADAVVWRPAADGARLPPRHMAAHVRRIDLALARHRHRHGSSVIDREAAAVMSALHDACVALDLERAAQQIARLIGWGEGLTPAGDDAVIGLLAGLDPFAHDEPLRTPFRRALADVVGGLTARTTPIAAHYLRLAADGHYIEPLLRLRRAVLCDDHDDVVDAALRSALAVGATSGADTVSGLSAGLHAWQPMTSCTEAG
jgi:hypothetical protein